ncbi:MAG: RHS repeat-associated core domain-containing protein [Lachnospirales bacterium]
MCYTEYEYDGVGNLLKSKAANGQNVTTYQYNSLNRVTKMTDPMGKSETYTYDISGNMINKVDRNNTNLVYEYDPMNRLTMERAKVGNDYVLKGYYAYTLTGNLKISQGYYNRFVMNYDEYGRLKNIEIKQNENYFKYFYNYLDNKRGLVSNKYLYKYSNSNFTGSSTMYAEHKYTYDAENNVTKIQTRGTENPIVYKDLVSYTYDKTGNLTKEVKGNVTTDYTYNIGNLVTNMTNKNGQSVISTYSYSYNYDGNISKSVENGVTKNYKYDPMNRLVQENTKNSTYSYTYDNAGNRATMTATGSENFVKSYVYDKNNRLLEECKAVNNDKYITNYQYDNNGNTVEKVKSEVHSGNTGTQSLGIKTSGELPKTNSREYFKYNVFNQLSTYYSTTIGKYTTYKYLSNGYRCYKNVKGVESYFIWDGDEIGAEYDANGNVTDVLYRGNNLVRDGKGNNYVYDSHGSVTSILNDNGSKSKDYEYDAFGNIENETNSNTYNHWQYCGEYTDQESGLIYLRNRYYDSETGRFINEDPARSGGNWYSYCSGNPVMFWDKMGLSNENIRISEGASKYVKLEDGKVVSNSAKKIFITLTNTKFYNQLSIDTGNNDNMLCVPTTALTMVVANTGDEVMDKAIKTTAEVISGINYSSISNWNDIQTWVSINELGYEVLSDVIQEYTDAKLSEEVIKEQIDNYKMVPIEYNNASSNSDIEQMKQDGTYKGHECAIAGYVNIGTSYGKDERIYILYDPNGAVTNYMTYDEIFGNYYNDDEMKYAGAQTSKRINDK